MKAYIKEYDKVLIKKNESETNYDYDISEAFNQRIKMMCDNENLRNTFLKRKRGMKYRSLVASFVVAILTTVTTGVVVNAATDGKIVDMMTKWFSAQVVNDENRAFIGKEVIGDINDVVIVNPEEEEKIAESGNKELVLRNSHIVKCIDSEMVQPSSIDEFPVIDGMIPEVIMTNGAAVIFYHGNYKGWKCDVGDKLIFDFSKYESEVVEEQALVIGYVLDGVMYNSEEVFRKVDGRYEFSIESAGEYYIYVISATSDYLTLREGEIKVEKQ